MTSSTSSCCAHWKLFLNHVMPKTHCILFLYVLTCVVYICTLLSVFAFHFVSFYSSSIFVCSCRRNYMQSYTSASVCLAVLFACFVCVCAGSRCSLPFVVCVCLSVGLYFMQEQSDLYCKSLRMHRLLCFCHFLHVPVCFVYHMLYIHTKQEAGCYDLCQAFMQELSHWHPHVADEQLALAHMNTCKAGFISLYIGMHVVSMYTCGVHINIYVCMCTVYACICNFVFVYGIIRITNMQVCVCLYFFFGAFSIYPILGHACCISQNKQQTTKSTTTTTRARVQSMRFCFVFL